MTRNLVKTINRVVALTLATLLSSVPALAGLTIIGSNGITVSGADGILYTGTNGITVSGADGVLAFGPNGITVSGADGITPSGADGITVSGADGITASGANSTTINRADGITVSGADSFVQTGTNALISTLTSAIGQSGIQSVDPELAVLLNQLADDSNIDAVIVYHHLPTDSDIADLQNIGVLGGTRYRALPMIAITTSKSRVAAISHLSSVRSIYGNRTFQWNLDTGARSITGVDRVRRDTDLTRANRGLSVSGRGVTVAVLDTGVDGTHADLSGRVVQNIKLADTQSLGVGFSYPLAASSLPNTDQVYGHGTFVAGVIAGNGQQSGGKYAGVAPNANILGLSAGDASLLFVLSGFDYLMANAAAFNVRVVNCSFSANTVFDVNDPVNIATKMLTDNGVNVVFSAGNTGPGSDSLNPYSVAPWVISTGATDNLGKLAGFSSRGEFGSALFHPTLVAPGVNTVSLRTSTVAAVTTVDGAAANDAGLSASELPYYTTGNGTSFSAPQVAGVIALMLEANPNLTPAQVRDILQRTATPLPSYYMYEVGAGMLNAQAAVLEAEFSQRHFGSWRGSSFQNQVQFAETMTQFAGSARPGSSNDSVLNIPANATASSVQIAWGGLLTPNALNLSLIDPQGTQQASSTEANSPGLTGKRQRALINSPAAGVWKARVMNPAALPVGVTYANTATGIGAQSYTGFLRVTTASYAPMSDLSGLDSGSIAAINQDFRSLTMSQIGSRFRPTFAMTRANLAAALVRGARVPQYLPAQSNYTDIRDRATMLFVESAQAAPNGALFPSAVPGGAFQPDATVDRLTAVVALVRAAGLRQQAASGTYTLPYADATSIAASLRGYVAVAVQDGLIRPNGAMFNPQGAFTRLDLATALAHIASM